jgi:hypothetical protein
VGQIVPLDCKISFSFLECSKLMFRHHWGIEPSQPEQGRIWLVRGEMIWFVYLILPRYSIAILESRVSPVILFHERISSLRGARAVLIIGLYCIIFLLCYIYILLPTCASLCLLLALFRHSLTSYELPDSCLDLSFLH